MGLSARGLAIKTAEPSRRGIPAVQGVLAGAAGEGQRIRSWSTRCSTARARQRRSASPSGPARRPCSTPRWRCIRASTSRRRGIAPLTSMFMFDANDRMRVDDYRDAVHDSNGLLLWTGKGEHDLAPARQSARAADQRLRRRQPARLRPDAARAAISPTTRTSRRITKSARPLWVEPIGDWGEGVVELVEIPSDREVNDNIVAFWRPQDPLKAKGEYTAELSAALVLVGAGTRHRWPRWWRRAAAWRGTRRTASSSSISSAAR